MRITLLSDKAIRLEASDGPLTIESADDRQDYSPFHMMAGALAFCTFSVFHGWAEHAKLDANDLSLEVSWEFADNPHRVGCYDVRFRWPSLPENRLDAARRAGELCTVHATFTHPPTITIDHVA